MSLTPLAPTALPLTTPRAATDAGPRPGRRLALPLPGVAGGSRSAGRPTPTETAQQLQGVFFEQMIKAMREAGRDPESAGDALAGQGEDMFTGLMDGALAGAATADWNGPLTQALTRAMARAQGLDASAPSAPQAPLAR